MNIINEELIPTDSYLKKIVQSSEDKLLQNEKLLEDTAKLLDKMKLKIESYERIIESLESRVDFLRKSNIKIDINKFEN